MITNSLVYTELVHKSFRRIQTPVLFEVSLACHVVKVLCCVFALYKKIETIKTIRRQVLYF